MPLLPAQLLLAAADAGTYDAEIRHALTMVPTFAAVLIRVGAMFMFAPLFGSGRIPKKIKAMIALVLAMTLAGDVRPVQFPDTIFTLAAAIAGELLFGLAMGMVMSLVFVGAQWAGEIIGQQLGFNLGEVFDPQFGAAGSIVSDLLFMLSLVIFLCIRGHHAMLLGLRDSFDAIPLFSAGIGPGGLDLLVGLFSSCTKLALKLIAPTIVSMLVADIVLGFISKTMPQMNVMSAGMSLRSLLGMVIIAAGLVFTSEIMTSAIYDSMDGVRQAWITPWTEHKPPGSDAKPARALSAL